MIRCRQKRLQGQRDWYLKNAEKHKQRVRLRHVSWMRFLSRFIIGYKTYLGCLKCGVIDFRVLDFHHHGNKEIGISKAVRQGWGIDRLLREISKCSILCSNCHRIETYESCKVS